MKISPIKTDKITSSSTPLEDLLDESIKELHEKSVVVISSKVVALCEGRAVPHEEIDREELIRRESELYYLPDGDIGDYPYRFTISQSTLISAGGIDSSNGNGYYVLWPENPHESANNIRKMLVHKFSLHELGVIISDSAISLSRWGAIGIAISHSGFSAIKNYIGQPDIFGRPMQVSKANIAGSIAAAAGIVMGEGSEQTPIAIVEDVPSLEFKSEDITAAERAEYYVSPLDDEPFMPFFTAVEWKRGGKYKAKD